MEEYFVGIDIGTGSTKAVALDATGRSLAVSSAGYPTLSPSKGYSEQDPTAVWEAFVQCFQELSGKLSGNPVAIGLSSAMHSLLPVDQKCRPLMNAMTWADGRAYQIAESLRESPNGEELYHATGTPVYSMSLLPRILWLREHRPEIFTQAYKFISIKEFIWYQLFRTFEIDYSIASATGLFNITHSTWDSRALQLAAIDPFRLSEPVPTTFNRNDLVPESRELLKLEKGAVFVIGASDGCLANLGTFAVDHRRAAITIGTSGAVRISSPRPVYNFGAMTFNYILDEDIYICGGPINNGGLSLEWLVRNFLREQGEFSREQYEALFKKIEAVPAGSDGLVFLPYLAGERAPVWDTRSKGAFFGIHLSHTQEHFCRSVLEGVCFALREVLEIVEDTTRPVEQVQLSGGFTGSRLWMQMLSDIIRKPVCIIQTNDASAIGAVFLAMKALRLQTDYSSLQVAKEDLVLPDPGNSVVYQKNFDIFKQLYPNLKSLMHL
jgi:gluconokinase